MAPEQWENARQVDTRADIYSLGRTLYHLLARRLSLSEGERARDLRPDVPAKLAVVLNRVTARKAPDRFATPAEVAKALQRFTAGHDLPALLKLPPGDDSNGAVEPDATGTPRWLARSRRGFLRTAAGAIVVLLPGDHAGVVPPAEVHPSPTKPRRIEVRLLGTLAGGHIHPITCLAFSPDGKTLATGSIDPTTRADHAQKSHQVTLWDVDLQQKIRTLRAESSVHAVAFSRDSRALAFGGNQGVEVVQRDQNWGKKSTLNGQHTGAIYCLAFSPDGQTLVSGSGDNTAIVWDAATRVSSHTLQGLEVKDFQALAFSPDAKWLASGHAQGEIRIWDTDDFQQQFVLNYVPPPRDAWQRRWRRLYSLAFSPDGTKLASANDDDPDDRAVKLWTMLPQPDSNAEPRLLKHNHPVQSLAFSADGRTLATLAGPPIAAHPTAGASTVGLMGSPLGSGPLLAASAVFPGRAPGIRQQPDLAAGKVTLWDLATWEKLGLGADLTGSVALASSPNGKTLAVVLNNVVNLYSLFNLPGMEKAAPAVV